MKTIEEIRSHDVPLETFLSGMETKLRNVTHVTRLLALKPSLVEWKLHQFCRNDVAYGVP